VVVGVPFQEKFFGFFILTSDTTWWSEHNILYFDTGMLCEPENILIRVTFQEKNSGIIYFEFVCETQFYITFLQLKN
jgi:hypothetical protein